MAPPVPVAVKVALFSVPASVSLTVAPVTALGPLLVTTITYVCVLPAATVVAPFVLTIERSADGVVSVAVAVALLLPELVSTVRPVGVRFAVFDRVPDVAVAE